MKESLIENVGHLQENLEKFKSSIIDYAPVYLTTFISALLILLLGFWILLP